VPVFEEFSQERQLSLSEQVVKIIKEEYDTPLTLEYCASKIGYHSSYVSRMFRQQIGYSFKEYLYLYRIDKSKQLLSFSDMKIQDISNKLCYNNAQNFIRMFKKVEGITPGEYRLKHQNQ
jgi:YesN/AraC family two-component response regulator